MSTLRTSCRTLVNSAARWFGARIVNASWGPRGCFETLRRAQARGFNPAMVLDIGASDGRWTHDCREVFPDARYFLADPLPENAPALHRLASADPRVRVWNGAIGAQPGSLALHCHGDQSSFLASREFDGPKREVPIRTLDSFVADGEFVAPLLLKADVQGHELEVLRGAGRCLELAEMLLLEVSFQRFYDNCPLAHEIVAFAGDRGFRLYDVCTYLQRATDAELVQSDFAFVRADSQLFAREGWA